MPTVSRADAPVAADHRSAGSMGERMIGRQFRAMAVGHTRVSSYNVMTLCASCKTQVKFYLC